LVLNFLLFSDSDRKGVLNQVQLANLVRTFVLALQTEALPILRQYINFSPHFDPRGPHSISRARWELANVRIKLLKHRIIPRMVNLADHYALEYALAIGRVVPTGKVSEPNVQIAKAEVRMMLANFCIR
jgi:hypothetical protein